LLTFGLGHSDFLIYVNLHVSNECIQQNAFMMAMPHPAEPAQSHFAQDRTTVTTPNHQHDMHDEDPMDVTPPAPNSHHSHSNGGMDVEHDHHSHHHHNSHHDSIAPDASGPSSNSTSTGGGGLGPASAAAATQQPKVVQTAFIHKLYNMLEDQSIQHLIAWSPSNESFVMNPSNEFSKVLSQYFKHTNISSFVRQLNMYGFHKG
jgi:hypothetical protein